MKKVYKIYKHTFENGKSYIGITYKRVHRRLSEHIQDAKNGSNLAFHRALRKYNYKIKTEILDECYTLEEANNLEKYYIEKYNTFSGYKDSKGYNQTRGGAYTGNKPKSLKWDELYKNDPEKRQKRREASSKLHKGKTISLENRKLISKSVKELYDDEEYIAMMCKKTGMTFKKRSIRIKEKELKEKEKADKKQIKIEKLKKEYKILFEEKILKKEPTDNIKPLLKKQCFKKILNLRYQKDYFKAFKEEKRFQIVLRMRRILQSNNEELINLLSYWMGRSSNCFEFYLLRGYEDFDEIDCLIKKEQSRRSPTSKEYWLHRGFSETEAKEKVGQLQANFSKLSHKKYKRKKDENS